MISEFVDEFKKDIPDNETELIEKFKSYLYSVIYNIKKSKSKFVAKDSESIKELLDKITKQLISEDLQGKKRILISDDNYEKINEISNEIFQLAQRKLNNEDIKIKFIKGCQRIQYSKSKKINIRSNIRLELYK